MLTVPLCILAAHRLCSTTTIERLEFGDALNRGEVDHIMSYFAAECT